MQLEVAHWVRPIAALNYRRLTHYQLHNLRERK